MLKVPEDAFCAALLHGFEVANQEIDVLVDFEILDGHVACLHQGLVSADHPLVDIDEFERHLPTLRRNVLVLLVD